MVTTLTKEGAAPRHPSRCALGQQGRGGAGRGGAGGASLFVLVPPHAGTHYTWNTHMMRSKNTTMKTTQYTGRDTSSRDLPGASQVPVWSRCAARGDFLAALHTLGTPSAMSGTVEAGRLPTVSQSLRRVLVRGHHTSRGILTLMHEAGTSLQSLIHSLNTLAYTHDTTYSLRFVVFQLYVVFKYALPLRILSLWN